MDERERRLAENEAMFREINETINRAASGLSFDDDRHGFEFLCECSRTDCAGRLRMTVRDYDDVRGNAARFAVLRNHDEPDIEVVVADKGEYLVVEKIGDSRAVVEKTNPRAA